MTNNEPRNEYGRPLKPTNYVGPEYTVPLANARKSLNKSRFTVEELEENYGKFVAFRDTLRKLKFLPEDADKTNEFSFVFNPEVSKRTVKFIIDASARLEEEEAEERRNNRNSLNWYSNRYDAARAPIVLFEAHLQTPTVHGFTPVASRLENIAFAKFLEERDMKIAPQGLSYKEALHEFRYMVSAVKTEFKENDVEFSNVNLIRFLAMSRYSEKGYAAANVRDNEKMRNIIFELLRYNAPLYASMLVMSKSRNPDFKGELFIETAALESLEGVPESFVRPILLGH